MAKFRAGDNILLLTGGGARTILFAGTQKYFILNENSSAEYDRDIVLVDADYELAPAYEGNDIVSGFYFTDNNNKLNLVLAVVGTRAIIFYLNNAGNAIGKEYHVDTIATNLNDGSFVEVVA